MRLLILYAVLVTALALAATVSAASTSATACTITGTNGHDVLVGTDGDDVICGRGGSDVIYGAAGDDIIHGDKGNDIIYGDEGDDVIYGDNGRDFIAGGPGDDIIDGGRGHDYLYGGSGYDTVTGGPGNDVIHGGLDVNCLNGGPGRNVMPNNRCDPRPAAPTTPTTPTGPTVPEPSLAGSRANPIPVGQAATLHDSWVVTVNSVTPNATGLVLAENQFNDPPEAGRQFFIVNISATYTGQGSDWFNSSRLEAVGPSAVAYSTLGDSCGVIPGDFPDFTNVFTGGTVTGNICWSVRSSDAGSLVMFDDDVFLDDSQRVWFKLG
ncbi:MAG: calcium-binding protein [Actinomycetia bacterium]|nr:calcium-binding protein [Actinomycetes bacterium]